MTDPNDKTPDAAAPMTALTVKPAAQTGVQSLGDFAAQLAGRVWTSLPMQTAADKMAILVAIQGDAEPLGDHINERLEVTNILVHSVEIIDDDGTVIDADRVVLVTPAGVRYAAASMGVRKSVQMLIQLFGLPPFSPPMPLRVVQTNTRRGHRLYQLLPWIDATSPKPAK